MNERIAQIIEMLREDGHCPHRKPGSDCEYLSDYCGTCEHEIADLLTAQAEKIAELEKARDEFIDSKLLDAMRAVDLQRERDNARAVLLLIRGWDMLDATSDGPYWKREIDKALKP